MRAPAGLLSVAPLLLALAGAATAARLEVTRPPELFLPGLVSTGASEVKIAFSPDGKRMLWGSTNRPGGPGGWDVWESVRTHGRWSAPRPAAFDSPANDFDPCFAPDGRGVWFFSNRAGGLEGAAEPRGPQGPARDGRPGARARPPRGGRGLSGVALLQYPDAHPRRVAASGAVSGARRG
jgi:hypothetical protein